MLVEAVSPAHEAQQAAVARVAACLPYPVRSR
jgi:hypothetical protein